MGTALATDELQEAETEVNTHDRNWTAA